MIENKTTMNYIPNSLRMAAEKMGFNRSRFRLETQGATSASPGQSISIQLPENALIDLKSFRLMCDVTTNMDNTLPPEECAAELVQQLAGHG
jgi:hypothetical protein